MEFSQEVVQKCIFYGNSFNVKWYIRKHKQKNTHKNLYQVEDFNISDIFLQKSKTLSNDQFIQQSLTCYNWNYTGLSQWAL